VLQREQPLTNKEIRERLHALWKKQGQEALDAHCGGMGLVVGCPVCGRIFGKFKLGKRRRKR
jgi:hypothetical protein